MTRASASAVARGSASFEPGSLHLHGELAMPQAAPLWHELRPHIDRAQRGSVLNFEMSKVERADGAIVALLSHLRSELKQRGVSSEFVGANSRVQDLIHLYRGDAKVGRKRWRRAPGTLEQIGRATLYIVREVQRVLGFVGQLVLSLWAVLRSPRTANWRELPAMIERAGADALPIVLMINFLVGLVMASQSTVQLKTFGANLFIADLIGISMTRELGPLMTAIVLTGRSGAAFAAELGSMKVNEEIDALRTLGFGPLRYLVFPRLLALMLVLPVLALFAELMGIFGGLLIAISSLGLTSSVYVSELHKAVKPWDLYSGLIKSVLFGFAIALIASQQGLATEGGAEGVGRRTTGAVVTTLFALIVIDATYTALFRAFDL